MSLKYEPASEPLHNRKEEEEDGAPGRSRRGLAARVGDVWRDQQLPLVQHFHDRVARDGERGEAVGPDLLEECRDRADDVVEGVEGVVVHPFDDLQTLPHAQEPQPLAIQKPNYSHKYEAVPRRARI